MIQSLHTKTYANPSFQSNKYLTSLKCVCGRPQVIARATSNGAHSYSGRALLDGGYRSGTASLRLREWGRIAKCSVLIVIVSDDRRTGGPAVGQAERSTQRPTASEWKK